MTSAGIVLDASVVLSWAFEDECAERAIDAESVLISGYACVPSAWSSEISNALVTATRRGRISARGVEDFLDQLAVLDIRLETPAPPAPQFVQFALDCGLSAHDAEYVLLASEREIALATADRRMREAAKALGVQLLG